MIVLDGDPASPPQKRGGTPQFSARVCCAQMAAWIKMPLGMEAGLGPSNFLLDGDPAPSPPKAAEPPIFGPCLLCSNGWVDQDGTWHGGRPRSRPYCARWGPSYPPQNRGQSPPFSVHFYCGQTAGCIKMPLGMEVGLSPGDFVLDVDPALPLKGVQPPIFFRPMFIVAKRLNGSRCQLVRR